MSASFYKLCTLCPRECKADRTQTVGFCGMTDKIYAARAMVHTSEEPCISGTRGSGAIFFSGCVLRCAFCQNSEISHGHFGKEISERRLSEIILSLAEQNVHNINLVSATQFYPSVLSALDSVRHSLDIPIVWNTGGYEKTAAVKRISEHCDIFLQDIKFYSNTVSSKYALCKDYFSYAMSATEKMLELTGDACFDQDSIMKKGVIIRHLVLPSNRKDSIELLKAIKRYLGTDGVILSLMSQYTPPLHETPYRELGRRITDFEYRSVCETALELGFKGYFQERESAQRIYTPLFDLSGL